MKIAIQGAAGRMGRMLDTLAAGFGLALKKNFRVYEVSKEDGMQRVLNDGTDMLRLSLQPGDAVLLRFQDAAEQPFLIDYVLKK